MARLIDADALNKELQKRLGSPTDDKLYEVNLCIIDAPTIDAIPVEWLNEMKRLAADYGDNECVDVIAYLFYRWQKEQEAQDGKTD